MLRGASGVKPFHMIGARYKFGVRIASCIGLCFGMLSSPATTARIQESKIRLPGRSRTGGVGSPASSFFWYWGLDYT